MSQFRKNSDSRRNEEIVEDAPVMRSVSMLSGPPPMPMRSAAPLARSKLAPPAATPLMREYNIMGDSISTSTPKATIGAVWDVESAPAIPSMYFLERTHVRISDTPVQEVAFRIAECLRKLSIPTSFDDDDQALLLAETPCHCHIAVRLWSDNGEVVVEVQRSAGCSFVFHQVAKAVMKSGKGQKTDAPSHRRSNSPPAMPLPRSFALPDSIPRETEEERMDSMQEGLDIAADLLMQPGMDAQVMAMESLIHLTKVCKSQGFAAQTILSNPAIVNRVVEIIESNTAPSGQSSERSLSEMEEGHLALLRCECLHLLADCLASLRANSKLQQVLHSQPEKLCSETLVMALVDQMSRATEEPHPACHAVRCLQALTEASGATKRLALELGAGQNAKYALAEGQCRSVQLQECSEKLRQTIMNEHL